MVKDHSDSEKGNPLLPHRLLLSINSKVFYMHHPTDRITHTMAFVTPVVEHCLEREIAQWVYPMKDRSYDPSHHERMLYLWATSHSLTHLQVQIYYYSMYSQQLSHPIRMTSVKWGNKDKTSGRPISQIWYLWLCHNLSNNNRHFKYIFWLPYNIVNLCNY